MCVCVSGLSVCVFACAEGGGFFFANVPIPAHSNCHCVRLIVGLLRPFSRVHLLHFPLNFHCLYSSKLLVHLRKVRDIQFFPFLCCRPALCVCVWCFRRWLSSSLYQTTATFVLGQRPPYVELPHRFSSEFRFIKPSRCRPSSPSTFRAQRETALQCLCGRLAPLCVSRASVLMATFTQHVHADPAVN